MKYAINIYLFAVVVFIACLFFSISGCDRVIEQHTCCQNQNPPCPPTQPPVIPPVDPTDPTKPPPVATGPSFKDIQTKVLTPYCLRCHNGGTQSLASYNEVMRFVIPNNSKNSKLCEVVSNGRMPIGNKLPDNLIKDLCKWIDSGANQS